MKTPSPLSIAFTIAVPTLAACARDVTPAWALQDAVSSQIGGDAAASDDDARAPHAGGTDASDASDAFVTADHPPLQVITDHGGPRLANPQLVVVTFADDPGRADDEALTTFIAGSNWLREVGQEYGIGAGSILGVVERPERAPDSVSDTEITAMLAAGIEDHSIPRPADGTFDNVEYVVFYPEHTVITTSSRELATSCADFGGFHDEAQIGAMDFAYVVIPTCPDSSGSLDRSFHASVTSHEIIEAATDPFCESRPALVLGPSSGIGWGYYGGEVGDLCELDSGSVLEGGYTLQRIWSNDAAARGTSDPCVPAPSAPPYYFNVTMDPGTVLTVPAGTTTTLTLHGFSYGPMNPWTVEVEPEGVDAFSQFDATVRANGSPTISNGNTTNFTVGVPAGTPSGTHAIVTVYAFGARVADGYRGTPVAVVVP